MMKMKHVAQAALGLVVSVAASSAMALNATAILDTALLTANSLTVTALGAASYNSTSGALTVAEASASAALATFATADGFKVTTSYGPLSFTNFTFNNAGVLTGKLQGGGLLLSGVTFTGNLLEAASINNVSGGVLATNFAASPALSSYLIDTVGLSPATVGVLGTLLVSMNAPGLSVPTSVPEPSTYALMGLGLVGISLVARRRQA